MPPTDATSGSQRQIFISYATNPTENQRFVRDLTGRLRVARFAVWLDEEKIPGGERVEDVIRKAAQQSEVGLFIVTHEWKGRPWTQFEVNLFGERHESRRVAIVRDDTVIDDLGPYLAGLKRISWPPSDTQPNARFWEVYCGITGTEPGPREQWDENGLRVGSGGAAAPSPVTPRTPAPPAAPATPDMPEPRDARTPLRCTGTPVDAINAAGYAFVVTDLGEWVCVEARGQLHGAIPRLTEHSAAMLSAVTDDLLVAMYDPIVARLSGNRWEYLPQPAPVLCMTSVGHEDVAGTSSGAVVSLNSDTRGFRMRDPVTAMGPYGSRLLLLGSRGSFGHIAWPPAAHEVLDWIETGDLGRPMDLFQALESDHVGVASATRIGIIDSVTEAMVLCPNAFEDGIRKVGFLGAQQWPYAVLTDAGQVVLVDAALRRTRAIQMPARRLVRGVAAGGSRWCAVAWTDDGRLHGLFADGTTECIAEDHVVVAYASHDREYPIHAIRAQAQRVTVERLRV